MNKIQREVKGCTAKKLAYEYSRLLSLADEDDFESISLEKAKRLVYVEEELNIRLHKLLPRLPKISLSQIQEEEPRYMNEILGSYHERKSKKKSENQIRFFVKVKNNLNSTIAMIPVMAIDKPEAKKIAEEKSIKFSAGRLTFEVS